MKLESTAFGVFSMVLKQIKAKHFQVFDFVLFYYGVLMIAVPRRGENIAIDLFYNVFIYVSWKLIWKLSEGFKFSILHCFTMFVSMISVDITFRLSYNVLIQVSWKLIWELLEGVKFAILFSLLWSCNDFGASEKVKT